MTMTGMTMTMPAARSDRAMARSFGETAKALLAALMLLVAMLTGSSAWARDDGQWQVLSARYGTAQRNIAAATVVATQSFENDDTLVMIVTFSLVALAVLFAIAWWLRSRFEPALAIDG